VLPPAAIGSVLAERVSPPTTVTTIDADPPLESVTVTVVCPAPAALMPNAAEAPEPVAGEMLTTPVGELLAAYVPLKSDLLAVSGKDVVPPERLIV
jgi:hypothetical protein